MTATPVHQPAPSNDTPGPAECSPKDHIAELIEQARSSYADGRREGLAAGHEAGYAQGYVTGYSDGARSASAYKAGEAHGFITGYLERIGDECTARTGAM